MCYRSYYWDGPQKFIVGLLCAIDLITGGPQKFIVDLLCAIDLITGRVHRSL